MARLQVSIVTTILNWWMVRLQGSIVTISRWLDYKGVLLLQYFIKGWLVKRRVLLLLAHG